MKRNRLMLVWAAAAVLGVLAGCTADRTYLDEQKRFQYSYIQDENWAVREPAANPAEGFDIFYIYPVLTANREQPVMNWHKYPEQREKAVRFSRLQLDQLRAPGVGLYAPMVQQADLFSCMPYLEKGECDWDFQPTRLGIDDTIRAFRFYRGAHGKQRPFVLLGHSQGAIDLYRLLAHCPEITTDKGFVAAYLIGLPMLSAAEIEKGLAANGIKTARGADDYGVVVGWNSSASSLVPAPEDEKDDGKAFNLFCRRDWKGKGVGTYVINPVTWSTEKGAAEVRNAQYLDEKLNLRPVLDGFTAEADPVNGTLLVTLPADSVYDNHGRLFAPGVLHCNDFFFFAPYIRENMAQRVKAWRNRAAVKADAEKAAKDGEAAAKADAEKAVKDGEAAAKADAEKAAVKDGEAAAAKAPEAPAGEKSAN